MPHRGFRTDRLRSPAWGLAAQGRTAFPAGRVTRTGSRTVGRLREPSGTAKGLIRRRHFRRCGPTAGLVPGRASKGSSKTVRRRSKGAISSRSTAASRASSTRWLRGCRRVGSLHRGEGLRGPGSPTLSRQRFGARPPLSEHRRADRQGRRPSPRLRRGGARKARVKSDPAGGQQGEGNRRPTVVSVGEGGRRQAELVAEDFQPLGIACQEGFEYLGGQGHRPFFVGIEQG